MSECFKSNEVANLGEIRVTIDADGNLVREILAAAGTPPISMSKLQSELAAVEADYAAKRKFYLEAIGHLEQLQTAKALKESTVFRVEADGSVKAIESKP